MSDPKINPLDDIEFEAIEPHGYFKCECAVFPVGGNNSLCYTTSRERAEVIARQLNRISDLQEEIRKLKSALGHADAAVDDFGGVGELVEALEEIANNKQSVCSRGSSVARILSCETMRGIAEKTLAKHKTTKGE